MKDIIYIMSFIGNVIEFNICIILGTGLILGSLCSLYYVEKFFRTIYTEPFIPTKKRKLT